MKAKALILIAFGAVIAVTVSVFAFVSYNVFSDVAISQQQAFVERLVEEEAERLSLLVQSNEGEASVDWDKWIGFRKGQKYVDLIAEGNNVVSIALPDKDNGAGIGLVRGEVVALLSERNDSGYFNKNGVLYLWSRTHIGDSGLTLLSVHYDISLISAALSTLSTRLIMMALIVIWISLWVVMMVATVVSRHLDRQNKQLEYKSLHDELTGLGNRMLLQRELKSHMTGQRMQKQWLALLIADIDRFKEINNTLGHDTGDAILREVAARLGFTLPKEVLLIRLSSDEFGVVVMLESIDECNKIIQQINDALVEPLNINGNSIKIDMSVGCSIYPRQSHDAGSLIRHAEIAMYTAKESAGKYAFYSSNNDPHTKRRLELRSQLRSAIDNKNLMLHFQPKLNLKTREFDSIEALVRWYHPSKGMIYPQEIFSLAEQTGTSRQLSRWILEECIAFCAKMHNKGRKLSIAVNLTAADLQQHGFAEHLSEQLRKYTLPPDSLTLEVTEMSVSALGSYAMTVMSSISKLGVQISIDDFGTGFTSLAILSRLPINEIKIDSSLIDEFEHGVNEALIHSLIEMSHGMSYRVVAEGVESVTTLKRLQKLECDAVQGYYLCRPIDEEELMGWLNTSSEEMVKVALK